MLYIDIDGVLAASDDYIISLDERAKEDIHLLFKTIYRNYDKAFKYSKPLIDLSVLKQFENFALLTALPNKAKIDSFCKDDNELKTILNQLAENKKYWVKNNIGEDTKLYIVDKRADKIKFCKGSNDILIDDSDTTCGMWRKAGGQAFTSVKDFLNNGNKSKVIDKVEDKVELW